MFSTPTLLVYVFNGVRPLLSPSLCVCVCVCVCVCIISLSLLLFLSLFIFPRLVTLVSLFLAPPLLFPLPSSIVSLSYRSTHISSFFLNVFLTVLRTTLTAQELP